MRFTIAAIAAIAAIARSPAIAGLPAIVAVVALVVSAGCGGGDDRPTGSGACGAVSREALDPRSTQHLLPGAPEPEYASDPPTSGPHLAGDVPAGAQRQPVSRPAQVTVLETGGIMIQHRGLDGAGRRRVEALAARDVVTAPNSDLPGAGRQVVVTAWRHRLTCRGAGEAEVDAIREFVDAHRGKGPSD